MVSKREHALDIAARARAGLETIYGRRLRGVYVYGSAARGQLRSDSDIDIAIILDQILDKFAEHERTSELGSRISLDAGVLVSFFFAGQTDFEKGRFAVHRAIKEEGIPA